MGNAANWEPDTVKAMCTVVARNYLAHARVLARSFAAHHPGVPVHVLVLDDLDGSVLDAGEPFVVVRPQDVVGRADLRHMQVMYDVLEFATAVKPWLLRELLDRYGGPVCYLDPDIAVFSPLTEAVEAAERQSVVLTPHLSAPLPRDGRTPDEDFILKSGVFNLGFVTVAAGSEPFLDWWRERLRTDCIVAPERQRFVDQRWIDLAIGVFEHEILRHPGYNVAYWNISTRFVRGNRSSGYSVDGKPLRFFHFSGFDVLRDDRLSRHEGALPRHQLAATPSVAALAGEYRTALRSAGLEDACSTDYGYSRLPDGTPLDRPLRRAYREGLLRHERSGERLPPDPFDDPESFHLWRANAEIPSAAGWRYTDRWSPFFPEELEHLLMAVSRRPVARRALARLARWSWAAARKLSHLARTKGHTKSGRQ